MQLPVLKIFLSYNRKNQPFVKAIAQQLSNIGFSISFEVFFDEDNLMPGNNWANEIDKALSESDVCIVCLGEYGIGGWQNKEVLKAVNKCVDTNGSYKIIPLILPVENRNLVKNFPWFLADYQWVEFKEVNDQFAFGRLLEGIRDNKNTVFPVNINNPYKGLGYFDIHDAQLFFGRNFDLNWVFYKKLRLTTKNSGNNFLAIVGDSGSGKSSFVRAGILASLKSGKYEHSNKWLQVITKPEDRPLLNLSSSLQKHHIIEDSATFDKKALGGKDQLRRVLEVYDNKIILFIDQFEEILTQCKDESERTAYLSNLVEANKSGKVLILITLRSDYYTAFTKYTEFADILETNNYTLSGLDFANKNDDWEKRIIDIIEMPAKLYGAKVEKSLTRSILQNIKDTHGVLPLLQMTLSQLWKEKQGNDTINLNDYEKVSGGKGIEGIIEKHAEKVYENYIAGDGSNKKEILVKNIFIRLVELTANKDDVRRTIRKENLETELAVNFTKEEIEHALMFLSGEDSRLLSIRIDEKKQAWIEVIHEVLIRNWERLKTWVNERREALVYKENLLGDIEEYTQAKGANEFLYSGARLKKTKKWLQLNEDLSNNEIKFFINISAKKQVQKKIFIGSGLLVIVLIIYIFIVQFNLNIFKNSALAKDLKSRNINIDSLHFLTLSNQDDFKYLSRFKNVDSLVLFGNSISDFSSLHLKDTFRFLELGSLLNVYNFFDIEGLSKIKTLLLYDINSLQNLTAIKNLNNLTALSLIDLKGLQNLSGIEKLNNLTGIELVGLEGLQNISGVEKLQKLTSIKLDDLKSVRNLPEIQNLKSITSLELNNLHDIRDLSFIEKLKSLTSLTIDTYSNIQHLNIENLKKLTSLTLRLSSSFLNFSQMGNLRMLTTLTLDRFDSIYNLLAIEKLNNLTSLELDNLHDLQNLSGIEQLNNLHSLTLENLESLQNLSGIENLNLIYLQLGDIDNVQSLSEIKNLKGLTSLKLDGFDSLQNLAAIKNLEGLTTLDLEYLPCLQNLSELKNLKILTSLTLYDLKNLQSLSGIENLTDLTSLDLEELPDLQNLSGIENLQSLSTLKLKAFNNEKLDSFLVSLPSNLTKIYLEEGNVTKRIKEKIKNKIPKCQILFIKDQ